MRARINFMHLPATKKLRDFVSWKVIERLQNIGFDSATAHVTFHESGPTYDAHIQLHGMHTNTPFVSGKGQTMSGAFEQALVHLEYTLRKENSRRREHRPRKEPSILPQNSDFES